MYCPVPENSKQRRSGVFQPSRQVAVAFLLTAVLLGGVAAHAASGKDPTVPPAAWQAATAASGTQAALHTGDTSSVRLVLVGKTRRLALIDGQVIKAGDTYNGARVESVGRSQVLMEDKEKSLKLAPGVEKKKASHAVAPKQPKRIIVGGTPAANEKQTGNRSSQ